MYTRGYYLTDEFLKSPRKYFENLLVVRSEHELTPDFVDLLVGMLRPDAGKEGAEGPGTARRFTAQEVLEKLEGMGRLYEAEVWRKPG